LIDFVKGHIDINHNVTYVTIIYIFKKIRMVGQPLDQNYKRNFLAGNRSSLTF